MNRFVDLLKEYLKVYISISLGVFLFVLFFQPFSLDSFDFNNRILFVAGFGLIVFLFLILIRVVFIGLFAKGENEEGERTFTSYLSDFVLLALTAVAVAFYLRYVGQLDITIYSVLKIVIICLSLPVVLNVSDIVKHTKLKNRQLIYELRQMQEKVNQLSETQVDKFVELISESNSDNFQVQISNMVYVKSADNYVEVGYMEGDDLIKKLIRNTLKNIEQQLKVYNNLVRTHRTCIVNTQYIDKLNRNYNTWWISLTETRETIPVSRQYLMLVKELL